MVVNKLLEWLKLEEIRSVGSLDDCALNAAHARIIKEKPFLRKLYRDFYGQFKNSISTRNDERCLVELGSGCGFIKEVVPGVITSDIMGISNVDKHFSALKMPFQDKTVDAFFMIDVFHHINDAVAFFRETNRCLKDGGRVIMIEPANTHWSRFIYKNFHHENFNLKGEWSFGDSKPLLSSNAALPWIVFCRDRQKFEREFPCLKISALNIHTPVSYLVSGGLSVRQLLPSFTYDAVKFVEKILKPLNRYLGMFMTVEIEKKKS